MGLAPACRSPSPMTALHSPSPPLPTDVLRSAVARAATDAATVGGASAYPACGFHVLDGPPGERSGPPGRAGLWVLVACQASDEAAQQAHLRERCRTAAQRFTLALWADRIPAVWTEADADASLAALAPPGMAPVGLVWCPMETSG